MQVSSFKWAFMNILIEWTLDFQICCLEIVIMQFYVAMEICIAIH